jgi:chromosomal replication initiator protein
METVWNNMKTVLKDVMDKKNFSLWVKPLQFLDADEGTIYLGCPNKFSRNWVQENYSSLFQSQLSTVGCNDHKVIFKILPHKESIKPNHNGGNGNGRQLILPNMPKKIRAGEKYLNARFTFNKFVVGECNEFAYSVSKALANGSHSPYSSLFLMAQTGLGKSHLIQAIGNTILQKKPSAKVLYITTEDFTNEMIYALKNNLITQFKNKYRKVCDVLLLEELHFLSGKEKTQTEISYTLDSLFNDEKMVIFTSPLMPEEIPNMKKMLISRFTSGVITSIKKPDFHTRLSILKQKALEREISLPEDVACFMAENLTQDVRQLEGSLDSLKAISFFLKKEIKLDLTKEIVKQLIPAKHLARVEDIQKIVCKYFKIDRDVLKSKSRKKIITYPRSIAIYLCRRYTDKSLESIGRSFNRNHSTVLYDEEKINKNIKIDNDLRREVEFLCRQIEDRIA